jgi:Protein of unknown function (DUF1616)
MTYRRLIGILLGTTIVAAAMVAIGIWTPLRALVGVPLVLVLPGALWVCAVVPLGSEIDWRLRSVLSVALSIVISLALGVSLGLIFGEISRGAGALGLGLIGFAGGVAAIARADDGEVVPPPLPKVPLPVVAGSAALLIGCVVLTVATLRVDALPGTFSALALSMRGGNAVLTVENHDDQAQEYRYSVLGDGRTIASGRVEVAADASHTFLVPVPAGVHWLNGAIYREGPDPYRSVRLKVPTGPAKAGSEQ